MRRYGRAAALCAIAAILALVVTACGRGGSTDSESSSPGITSDTIKIGGICPSSGPIAEFATSCAVRAALFKYLNATQGGVKMGDGHTRKIEFKWYDDAYDPAKTIQQAKRLVEQDKVAFLMGSNGTPTNLAIRGYLNKQKIPQLVSASGSTLWGFDADKFPWTMGFQTAYSTEASIYADFVGRMKPGAKVAILYQNDDFGKDFEGAFARAAKSNDITVVSKASYDPTAASVDSQVTTLAGSGANVLMLFTVPKFATQAMRKAHALAWKPMIITNGIANSVESVMLPAGKAAVGVYAGAYSKDPTTPRWRNSSDGRFVRMLKKKYGGPLLNPADSLSMLGLAQGEDVIYTLEHTKTPTRQGIMDSARDSAAHEVRGLLPGIKLATGKDDPFPMESIQMERFNGKFWVPIGKPVVKYEGRTPPPGTKG